MPLTLTSSAFENGGFIPARFSCDGDDISPPLEWSSVPRGTESFALIVDDPDAPAKTWVHWLLYNIPSDKHSLNDQIPEGKTLSDDSMQGINDFNNYGYGGPCPPRGTHNYSLRLYALDTKLDLEPGITKKALLRAMEDHIIAQTELIGKYKRE